MGTLVNDAMAALNKANKGGELEKNYVTAAIDALNTLLTSDVSPRMASKIARFRNVLKDYAKQATPRQTPPKQPPKSPTQPPKTPPTARERLTQTATR